MTGAAALPPLNLRRKARALLGGGNPRTGQPVWRNSYYVGQIEKQIWRPFADGTRRGGARLAGALRQAARRLERSTAIERRRDRRGTRNGVLGQVGVDVYEELLEMVDYATGRLEPAIATLAERTGHCHSAVCAALRRLRDHGFLHWVRRSEPINRAGEPGPQVRQATNAYVLLIPPALKGLVDLLFGRPPAPADDTWRRAEERRRFEEMLASVSAREFLQVTWNGDPLQGETLARIAAALDAKSKPKRESSRRNETGVSIET